MSTQMPRIASDNPSALPPGTRLGEFELLSLLGVGGFGIVYLAFDHALEREVAVKEYMPASLAGRTETMHVSLRSQTDAETFALGLKSFVNEAKMLARFDHPSLLKVHRFWEANGTAYMAMPVMRGRTLKEVRAQLGVAPDEAWLRALLTPLLGAIERLHSEGVYHRDIAPDNIQIDSEGQPVLLDFGAARRVINDKSQTLTAILKPAYAPIEQYAEAGSVKQGPWTDLYALGATLHYLLLNRPPPPATTRAVHDEASALTAEACPGCSENFLRTVDWMLAPRPADRPQNVAALREVLEGRQAPPLRREDAASPSQWERTVIASAPPVQSAQLVQAPVAPPDPDATRVIAPPAPAGSRVTRTDFDLPLEAPPVVPLPPPPPPAPDFAAPPVAAALAQVPAAPARRSWLPLGLGLGVVAVAGLAFALWPRGAAVPAVDAAASAALAASAAVATASLPGGAASAPAVAVPESKITTVVVPESPARAAATAPAPAPARPGADKSTSPTAAETARATQRATTAATPAATAPTAPPPVVLTPAAPVAATPAQTSPAAVAPALATAASQAPKAAVATGPEAVCEGRNPVLYFVCMERECLRSKFTEHADCQKWRKEARREVN